MLAAVKVCLPGVVVLSAGLAACKDPAPPAGLTTSAAPSAPPRIMSAAPAALLPARDDPPHAPPGARRHRAGSQPAQAPAPPGHARSGQARLHFLRRGCSRRQARLDPRPLRARRSSGIEGDDLDHRGPRRAIVQGQRELRHPRPRRRARQARRCGAHRVDGGIKHARDHQAREGQGGRPLHRPRRPLRRGAAPGRQAHRNDGQAPAGALRQADQGPRAGQLRRPPAAATNGCHVLLVSPAAEGELKRWFALGFGGAAMLAEEASISGPSPSVATRRSGRRCWPSGWARCARPPCRAIPDPGLLHREIRARRPPRDCRVRPHPPADAALAGGRTDAARGPTPYEREAASVGAQARVQSVSARVSRGDDHNVTGSWTSAVHARHPQWVPFAARTMAYGTVSLTLARSRAIVREPMGDAALVSTSARGSGIDVEPSGVENVPTGPFVYCSNHQSLLDVLGRSARCSRAITSGRPSARS